MARDAIATAESAKKKVEDELVKTKKRAKESANAA